MSVFSKRSKDALKGVHPNLVKVMEEAIKQTPVDFTIDQGVRTQATQQKYYSWGRTVVNPNSGPLKNNKFGLIVTYADGVNKKSNHQVKSDGYGHAIDLYPFKRDKDGKGYLDFNDETSLKKIADHIKSVANKLGIKITWGGDWKKPYDPPHFQLA